MTRFDFFVDIQSSLLFIGTDFTTVYFNCKHKFGAYLSITAFMAF